MVGKYYEFLFYDHVQREDEEPSNTLGTTVKLLGEIINEDDIFYSVKIISCELKSNSTYWDIIKSTIIDKKELVYKGAKGGRKTKNR